MARFTVCIVTLVVFLDAALVSATITTTTTIGVEVLDRGQLRRCGEQIESQRLSSCIEYLRDSSRVESMSEKDGWRKAFPRCCEELEQINEQCRCQAIKQVAQHLWEEGRLQEREKREMFGTAQSLTNLCRISSQSCEIVGRARTMF